MVQRFIQTLMIFLLFSSIALYAANPTCTLTIKNDTVISTKEYHFEVYLKSTGDAFSYSGASQFIISWNNTQAGGTSLKLEIIGGTSELSSGQAIASNKVTISTSQFRVAAGTPNLGSATPISNSGDGTRIGRFKLSSATNFNAAAANLAWVMSGTVRTKIYGSIDGVAGSEYTNAAGTTNNPSGTVSYGTSLTNAPLPVELTDFTSIINARDITLSWKTATEMNSSKFVVERKSEKSQWVKVAEVSASGNSNSAKTYSFTDKNLNSGKYSYRLKMIDNDGTSRLSPESTVEVSLPKEFTLSQNYPNPFNPATKIDYQLSGDSRVTIELYNLTGQKVMTLVNDTKSAGFYSEEVNLSSLSSGMYIYRIVAHDNLSGNVFTQMKKMVLLK